jgi:hypothetical protein
VIESQWLQIGEVGQISQLSVKTIRYYEELGLLAPSVTRSPSTVSHTIAIRIPSLSSVRI